MPVSVAASKLVYDGLKACDVRLVVALAESWLLHIIRMADEDPGTTLIQVAREEEAVGIAAGAHLGGMKTALLTQNHGLLASINPLVSLVQLYRIPLLMLISYRGSFGERDPWQTPGGQATEPVLRALDIPTRVLSGPQDVGRRIKDADTLAHSSLGPVAVLLTRELMWEES
jgi:sulfopyruvate decarboxylase subunit alpha